MSTTEEKSIRVAAFCSHRLSVGRKIPSLLSLSLMGLQSPLRRGWCAIL